MSLSGWDANKKIVCTAPGRSSTLTGFPVMLNLSASSGVTGRDNTAVFTELGTNSKKIAVEIGDTGVQCYVEIERWDSASNSAQLWVKIPSYLATVDTVLNFYYDSTQPDNTTYVGDTGDTPAQSVWSSIFNAVYHMAQTPSTGSATVLDSTSNGYHATPYGSPTLVDGAIGKAISFGGTNDYLVADSAALTAYPVTLSAVTKHADQSAIFTLVSLANDSVASSRLELRIRHDGGGGSDSVGNTLLYNSSAYQATGTVTLPTTSFTSVAAVFESDTARHIYTAGGDKQTESTNVSVPSGLNSFEIGRAADSTPSSYYKGVMDEVRVYSATPSADWLEATDLSNADNLITFSEVVISILASTTMPYGDLTAAMLQATDMPYSVLFARLAYLDMVYGIKLGMTMAMAYGDAPVLQQIMDQHYGDAPAIFRSMEMKYGDLLMLQKTTEMPYHILKPLQAIMEARYGINGEVLRMVMDQGYNLSEYNLLRQKLDMPYLLQSDAMVQTVSTDLVIAGNDIAFSHLNIERDWANFVITGEAHLPDLGQYMLIKNGDVVQARCNDTTYHLIVESKKRVRPGGVVTTFVVNFASPALTLKAPWSRPLQQDFEPGVAEDIINGLLGDHGPVGYPASPYPPFPVLRNTLYANNEDARTVIRKLTQSIGAVLQSAPDGSVYMEPEYPKGWNTAAPIDYFMTDERNFISQDESPVQNSGQNKFLVGNQLASDARTWPEQKTISDTEVEVIGFQVPWGSKKIHGLGHSGGDWVKMPEYMGAVEELYPPLTEDAEQVEFKAGFSAAGKPIYGELQVEWLQQSLGAITYGEDGKLEAELKTGDTDGYSLAKIRYLTRFHRWKVRDDVAEDVQYILWVEE